MEVPEKASCWVCRRTRLELNQFYHSMLIEGELPKWLVLEHIKPININLGEEDNKEKGFYICPFCREAIIQTWYAKFLGNVKKESSSSD